MALDQALSYRFILTSTQGILQLSRCCSEVLLVMLSHIGTKLFCVRGKPIAFELCDFNTAKSDHLSVKLHMAIIHFCRK